MKIREIFNLGIELGKKSDLRGRERVEKILKEKKEKFEKLSEEERKEFDLEALENPFLDSRIYNIAEDKEIKRVLVGIDIDVGEILMAKELGVDLVISHHPLGKGLANLTDVMDLQIEVLNLYGVPINIAQSLTNLRISEVARGLNKLNHERVVDAARLMKVNLMNIHTPADNLAAKFLKDLVEKEKPERISNLVDLLKQIPEYKKAIELGAGPMIFAGEKDNFCGKIAVTEITGGTEGSPKLYKYMALAGIGTVLSMHQSEEHVKEAKEAHINVVVAGHISSDSLGMNLFLDELEKKGIEIIPCSGLIRISRV